MEAERLWAGGPLFLQTETAKLTTDTVLLADFAQIGRATSGADLGCASGALMLLLLWREARLHMTGVELQADAAQLAEKNLHLNGMTDRGTILCGDLREEHAALPRGGFDFVIANPPYFAEGSGLPAPEEGRAAAREESRCTLKDLCTRAAGLCRSGGKVFLSYRPERLCELLRQCADVRLEPKRLRLVHHRPSAEASILLLEARKDGKPGLRIEPPLILHDEAGNETEEYKRIYHR